MTQDSLGTSFRLEDISLSLLIRMGAPGKNGENWVLTSRVQQELRLRNP